MKLTEAATNDKDWMINKWNMSLGAICKFTDWVVQVAIVYGQSWVVYTVLAWTQQSIKCIIDQNSMFYFAILYQNYGYVKTISFFNASKVLTLVVYCVA